MKLSDPQDPNYLAKQLTLIGFGVLLTIGLILFISGTYH